jgi:hypothetical protein
MILNPANVNITSTSAGTILAANLLKGFITRTGPTGNFNETLPATSLILAALGSSPTPFVLRYLNASAHTATFVAGDANTSIAYGAGMLGATAVLTNQEVEILFTPTGAAQNPGLTVTFLSRHTLV